jgi:hypothetical protein
MRAFYDSAERHLHDGSGVGKGDIDGVIAASDRAIVVDLAKVGFGVKESTVITGFAQSHDSLPLIETQPQGIVVRHGDLVMSEESDKIFGRMTGSVNDAPDILVVDANDRVAAAVAATGAAKFQILFPTLGHDVLKCTSSAQKRKISKKNRKTKRSLAGGAGKRAFRRRRACMRMQYFL